MKCTKLELEQIEANTISYYLYRVSRNPVEIKEIKKTGKIEPKSENYIND